MPSLGLGVTKNYTGNGTLKPGSPSLSLNDDDDDDESFQYTEGNYSSRLEEILGDSNDDAGAELDHDDDDDDEGFLYEGEDAPKDVGDYRSRLADVLGEDMDDEPDILEEHFVDRSLGESNDFSYFSKVSLSTLT